MPRITCWNPGVTPSMVGVAMRSRCSGTTPQRTSAGRGNRKGRVTDRATQGEGDEMTPDRAGHGTSTVSSRAPETVALIMNGVSSPGYRSHFGVGVMRRCRVRLGRSGREPWAFRIVTHCLSMGMGVSVATGLAGIHGRRIHHMPELDHPIVLALMALSRAFLFLLFRRVRWQ